MSNIGFWIPPDSSEMTSNDCKNNDAHQVEVSQIQILSYYRHSVVLAVPKSEKTIIFSDNAPRVSPAYCQSVSSEKLKISMEKTKVLFRRTTLQDYS